MSNIKNMLEEMIEQERYQVPPKMIITQGIPASGKSTWAEEYAKEQFNKTGTIYNIIERDEIRKVLFCQSRDLNTYKFSKEKENKVTEYQYNLIRESFKQGDNVIIADTNLNQKTVDKLLELADEFSADYTFKVFETPLHECIKRNQKREYFVPESVLIRMQQQLNELLGKPLYKAKEGLPRCIIVDIDGTLADSKGVRGPFEWNKVDQDKPIDVVVDIVREYGSDVPVKVFFFSGRDEICYNKIEKNVNNYDLTKLKTTSFYIKTISGKYICFSVENSLVYLSEFEDEDCKFNNIL